MKLVIVTQYQENYGAHSWDGVGECPQYWKNKGGEIYVVEGVEAEKWNEFFAIVEHACKYFDCVYSNNHSAESVIDWSAQENDSIVCESWETPKIIQLAELMAAK